jgi:hypothetical protein
MSFKKVAAIAVAAGALAAISVPAMAFENEFHGFYKMKYFLSNYENGGGGNPIQVTPTTGVVALPAPNTSENLKTNNYFEQRARIFYTAKASDDLKLVTGFEIDSVWGDYAQGGFTRSTTGNTGTVNAGTAFRNSGGAMESDAVNLETKWVYLDFKIPSTPIQTKVGIQAAKDSLKGIFLDADLAGIMTSSKVGSTTINVGYYRAYDNSYMTTGAAAKNRGQEDLHIGALEAKFALSKDLNLGGVYYAYADQRPSVVGSGATLLPTGYNSMMINVFGVTADAKVGPVDLSGFVATQFGVIKGVGPTPQRLGNAYQQAFAYNVAAKMAAGPGTLRTALLFTSGQSESVTNNRLNGWVPVMYSQNVSNTGYNQGIAANTYNESNMMLLNRAANMQGGTTDNSIVYQSNNGTNPINGQGVYLLSLGYDAKITPKFYANGNIGAAWAAKTNALRPTDRSKVNIGGVVNRNGSSFMGTELNVETGYKMYDNLTASFQAAYVMLGGYYNNSSAAGSAATGFKDPQNPYTVRTCLTYAF